MKDTISAETKWLNALGSFFITIVPFLLFFPDAVKGEKWATFMLATAIFVIDFTICLRLERYEKRILDLEYKTKDMK